MLRFSKALSVNLVLFPLDDGVPFDFSGSKVILVVNAFENPTIKDLKLLEHIFPLKAMELNIVLEAQIFRLHLGSNMRYKWQTQQFKALFILRIYRQITFHDDGNEPSHFPIEIKRVIVLPCEQDKA